jgi:hypothetical protein
MFGFKSKPKCVHSWRIVSDHVFESTAERAQRLGFNLTDSIPQSAFNKVHETILTCNLCGALEHYKEIV